MAGLKNSNDYCLGNFDTKLFNYFRIRNCRKLCEKIVGCAKRNSKRTSKCCGKNLGTTRSGRKGGNRELDNFDNPAFFGLVLVDTGR